MTREHRHLWTVSARMFTKQKQAEIETTQLFYFSKWLEPWCQRNVKLFVEMFGMFNFTIAFIASLAWWMETVV